MNNLKMEKTPLSFFVVNDIRNAMLETVNRLREENSHLVDEDTKNLFAQKIILTFSAEQMLKCGKS